MNIVGAMALLGRLPGLIELSRLGIGSKSPIVLLRNIPVFGTTTPDPKNASKDSVQENCFHVYQTTEK
ncbi:MAG: hypothetical protein CM1200mP8_3250 [Chloroflexota bacterium]|nr:MAG: hypothetical protein CM1200mP8_3250 [Chloroflexota bacterium]